MTTKTPFTGCIAGIRDWVGFHADTDTHGLKATDCRAKGGQYVPIPYAERLAKAGIEPSVGRVGDAYDKALVPPAKGEETFYANLSTLDMVA